MTTAFCHHGQRCGCDAVLPSLEDAYEECRQETAQWAKTFYLGTLLMPPAKRRAIWAI